MNSLSKRIPNVGACRLLSVTATQDSGVRLTLLPMEGERVSFTLSLPAYEQLGAPAKGDMLSPEQGDALVAAANLRGCLRHAANILGYGRNSERTLSQKLRRMGYLPEEIAYAIHKVTEAGLLKELDDALHHIEGAARKGWSRRKTYAYLLSRGYSQEVVRDAIEEALAEGLVDFEENRRRFIEEKQAKGLSPDAIRAALYRAGF